jgi:hypothetical protein
MKKIIILLLMCFGFTLVSFSQNAITQNSIITKGGTSADTVKKNTHKYYSLTATPYVKTVAYQVGITRTSGAYSKGYATLQKSYDNVKWYPIDSIAFAGSGTSIKVQKNKVDINTFYYRIDVYGIDSTQKNTVKLIILNELK